MEMASFCLKIRHVFGFTSMTERSIGAGPPVIIQLSGLTSTRGKSLGTRLRKLSEFGNGNKSEEVNRNVYFLFRCQIARFPGLKSFMKVHSGYIFDKFRLWFVEETIYLTHNFEINLIVTHFAVYYIV